MKLSSTLAQIAPFSIAFVFVGAVPSLAGDEDFGKLVIDDEAPAATAPFTICRLYDRHSTLYRGEGLVRRVKLFGRYHGQWEDVNGQSGGTTYGSRGWRNRRWRVGMEVEFANNITYSGNVNLNSSGLFDDRRQDSSRFVQNFEDITVRWAPSEDFYILVGKQKATITREYAESSNQLRTIERTQIVNNVISDKSWGVAVGFLLAGLNHEVGVYSNLYDSDWRLPAPGGGILATYRTSYEISESTEVFLDYQYNDVEAGLQAVLQNGPGGSTRFNTSPYEHVIAIGTENNFGRYGLITDVIYGANLNAGSRDTFGLLIMPFYDISDELQFVTRYAYMSNGELSNPQDSATEDTFTVNPRVDGLHTFYAGFNYHICGDTVRLILGYEYATGSLQNTGARYNSDAWVLAVRTHW